MSQKLSFITTTREDLFAISRIMMRAIEPQLLLDRDNPLVISIDGDMNSGKSILIDTLRSEMFDDKKNIAFSGREDYDEQWTATIGGKKAEIGFINVAWQYGFSDKSLNELSVISRDELTQAFLDKRAHGGITVLQNKNDGDSDPRVSIDIRVSKSAQDPELEWPLWEAEQRDHRWARHIEINVKKDGVLGAEFFARLDGQETFRPTGAFNRAAAKLKPVQVIRNLAQNLKNSLGLGVKR